jgi:hypothetical protein
MSKDDKAAGLTFKKLVVIFTIKLLLQSSVVLSCTSFPCQ